MRILIGLSVLVLLLACVSAGYQENEEAKIEAVESKDLDLTAENQKRDSEIQKRGFWDWLARNAPWIAKLFVTIFGKREDLNAEEQETQRRALFELYQKGV